MKRKRLAFFASIALVVIILTFWLNQESADGVRVQFIGITNDPSLGPVAILCVTNRAMDFIFCGREGEPQVHSPSGWFAADDRKSGLAYLERGESTVFTVPVPAGTSPWRMRVWWQRQDFTQPEAFINGQRSRLLDFFGVRHVRRDPWVPFPHTIYSPEIQMSLKLCRAVAQAKADEPRPCSDLSNLEDCERNSAL